MTMTSREKQAAFRARRKAAVGEAAALRMENAALRDELTNLRAENARLNGPLAATKVQAAAPVRIRVPNASGERPSARPPSAIRIRI